MSTAQQIKNNLIFGALRCLLTVAGWLPHRLALWIGGCLGAGFHALVGRDRQRTRDHLRLAFPAMPEPERRRLARRVFVRLGQTAMEFLKMFSLSAARVAGLVGAVEGREHMEAALARGRGVVCLAAHVDNWEILPIFTSQQGWRTAVVAQKLYDQRLNDLLNRFREQRGVRVIQRGSVTSGIIRGLRANMVLGILNDQDTGVDSRWALFFGKPAKTPVGIIRLARHTGAAVVPVFIAREPGGRHRLFIEKEIALKHTASEEDDLLDGAAQCNLAIENFIRRFPDQWVWFHERWKSQPEAAKAGI